MNLKTELDRLVPSTQSGPWHGHEYVKGYGVFGLPLSSGHVLALRVFPVNDFAPYITIWHQTPDGKWFIYYDAPRADVACPRYYGPAVQYSVPVKINLHWVSSNELTIRMDDPKLEWTVWMEEPMIMRLLNSISKRMPLWTWKHVSWLKPREKMASMLGLGNIKLSGVMPSGHFGILMPQQIFLIKQSKVLFEGIDLGTPVMIHPNPKIGDISLPARGVFAIGQAHWEILNEQEYHKTRTALSQQLI